MCAIQLRYLDHPRHHHTAEPDNLRAERYQPRLQRLQQIRVRLSRSSCRRHRRNRYRQRLRSLPLHRYLRLLLQETR